MRLTTIVAAAFVALALGCANNEPITSTPATTPTEASRTPDPATSPSPDAAARAQERELAARRGALTAASAVSQQGVAAAGVAVEALQVGPSGALSEASRAIFWGSAEDPPTEKLLGVSEKYVGRHYLVGDEWNLHLFYPHLKDIGGGYMGVGSDQAYVFVGWIKPSLAWLIDYDPWVIWLHHSYIAFFEAAETRRGFMRLWGDKAKGLELLKKRWAGHAELDKILEIYTMTRGKVRYRIRQFRAKLKALEEIEEAKPKRDRLAIPPTVYTDDDQYAYVRRMVSEGRVRPLKANLLDDKALRGVGASARALGVPIRAVYLSNAEQYWPYPKNFRDNIRGLPVDERSWIVRTLSTWSINKDYRYNLQRADAFQAWLARPWIKRVNQIVRRRKLEGPDDIDFTITTRSIERLEARRNRRKN